MRSQTVGYRDKIGEASRSSDLSCSLYTLAERQHFRFVNLTLAARQLGLRPSHRPARGDRGPHPACPDRARAVPCSWSREVPKIYCSAAWRCLLLAKTQPQRPCPPGHQHLFVRKVLGGDQRSTYAWHTHSSHSISVKDLSWARSLSSCSLVHLLPNAL